MCIRDRIKVIEITHLPRGKDGQFRQRVGQQGRPQFRRETACLSCSRSRGPHRQHKQALPGQGRLRQQLPQGAGSHRGLGLLIGHSLTKSRQTQPQRVQGGHVLRIGVQRDGRQKDLSRIQRRQSQRAQTSPGVDQDQICLLYTSRCV